MVLLNSEMILRFLAWMVIQMIVPFTDFFKKEILRRRQALFWTYED